MDAIKKIEAALAAGPTDGEWRRVAMGGGSTVLTMTEPKRNDTRIPAYGHKPENGYCIGYPFIHDDGGTRFDFVCMSHEDADYIAAVQPSNIREVLQTLASKDAEIAEAGLKYVSLFGELQNAMTEIERLKAAFAHIERLSQTPFTTAALLRSSLDLIADVARRHSPATTQPTE